MDGTQYSAETMNWQGEKFRLRCIASIAMVLATKRTVFALAHRLRLWPSTPSSVDIAYVSNEIPPVHVKIWPRGKNLEIASTSTPSNYVALRRLV